MATLAVTAKTLADWAKEVDPDGKTSIIVEMLSQENKIVDDMLFVQGNLPTGHRATLRTGLPTVYWRLMGQGTPPSKATSAQVDVACGMLEARSEVDVDLATLNGNVSSFRLNESKAFIEAMGQEKAETTFYGNASVNPKEFNGLAVQFSDTTASNGDNILLGGGSQSDNSSIWLVGWGMNTCFGVFPKGSKAGLIHRDLGEIDALDENNNRFRAYADLYQWKTAIVVKDWRYVVRIANIDISNLVAESSAADLFKLMIKSLHRIPSLTAVKPVFYMNRTCFEMLDIQSRNNVITGGGLNFKEVAGVPVYNFRGIPVRICDVLTETEATVS